MSGRALAEIKSAKDFSKFRKKAYRLDFAQDAVAPTGLIASCTSTMAMRHPELHLAVRLVIVGIAMTLVMASMLWHRREGSHAKRR